MNKSVSLVLGSGGARGYAHIGVIDELLARGYNIRAIAGCSMGALVGGLYAAGKLGEYRNWVNDLNYLDVIRLLDLSFRTPGMISGSRVFDVISGMIGDHQIEDLPIAYTAVATDLRTRKEVWFQEGSLLRAIRASIAIPSLFTPVEHNNRLLVDGGVINPLPIAPTVSAHTDLIIAVDLNADNDPVSVTCEPKPESRQERKLNKWLGKLKLRHKRYSESDSGKPESDAATVKVGMLDVFNQSLEVMQEALTRYKMAGYEPDILISVSRNQSRFYEFNRAEELIQVGRLVAARVLDNYEQQPDSVINVVS